MIQAEHIRAKQLSGAAKPPSVLLVEDDELIRMAMAMELREAGFAVTEASDAWDALRAARVDANFDVLVTDVRMPGEMNGIELAALLESRHPKMIVIISSGYIARDDLKLPYTVLPKPVAPTAVIREICAALAKRRL